MMIPLLIIILIILLLVSGFLSASETALFSISSPKVRSLRGDPSYQRKLIPHLLMKPKDLLVTILMINVSVNILVQNIASSLFGVFSSWWLNVGVPLLLTLFLGEAIPKSLAISHNLKVATLASPILLAARALFSPIRVVFTYISSKISRFFFFFLRSEEPVSKEELKSLLVASFEKGIITEDESKLIEGALKIDETLLKKIMIHKEDILYYDINRPLSELITLFVDEECTQVPIVESDIDNIIGIITSEMVFLHKDSIATPSDLRNYIKAPFFVPETMIARKLFLLFQEKKETIAIVVDEYGDVSGLVTKEDLVELVIGQIEDKRDKKELYTKQGEDVIICSGKLEIAKLEEMLDIELEKTENISTIGGWLTNKIGDIPKSGTKFVANDVLFHVLAATHHRVTRLYVRRLKPIKKKGGKEIGRL